MSIDTDSKVYYLWQLYQNSDDKVCFIWMVPMDLHAHQITKFPLNVIINIISATKTQEVPEFFQGVVQIPRILSKRNCAGSVLSSERAGRMVSGSSFLLGGHT